MLSCFSFASAAISFQIGDSNVRVQFSCFHASVLPVQLFHFKLGTQTCVYSSHAFMLQFCQCSYFISNWGLKRACTVLMLSCFSFASAAISFQIGDSNVRVQFSCFHASVLPVQLFHFKLGTQT